MAVSPEDTICNETAPGSVLTFCGTLLPELSDFQRSEKTAKENGVYMERERVRPDDGESLQRARMRRCTRGSARPCNDHVLEATDGFSIFS